MIHHQYAKDFSVGPQERDSNCVWSAHSFGNEELRTSSGFTGQLQQVRLIFYAHASPAIAEVQKEPQLALV